jgi:hypothetical protein
MKLFPPAGFLANSDVGGFGENSELIAAFDLSAK